MKTEWDYTNLANAYLKRPPYADTAIDMLLRHVGIEAGAPVCDMGAGTGILTRALLQRGLKVESVEPNNAMRALGISETGKEAVWFEGTGECSGRPDARYDLVTFGSSFNVTDRMAALQETRRILKPGGWFACMWNHRNLEDPHQAEIERIIRGCIVEYDHGARREDQMPFLSQSDLFEELHFTRADIDHQVRVQDQIEAWRSHATLARQAGVRFDEVVSRIAAYLTGLGETIWIPYTTRLWYGKMRVG